MSHVFICPLIKGNTFIMLAISQNTCNSLGKLFFSVDI